MNIKHQIENALPVECAVVRAGPEIMLSFETREGRRPIQNAMTDGVDIAWTCADGLVETPYIEGATASADKADLVRELSAGELLIAEFGEDEEPVSNWLMRPGAN